MIVLIDTSVWAEYFRRRSRLSEAEGAALDELIRDDRAAVVQPIRAEILSGRIKREQEKAVRDAFGALRSIDLDWNATATWDAIAGCAKDARGAGIPTVGIVDRMVLLAAERAGAALWSLDGPLRKLAKSRGGNLFGA